jgi:oxygen-independent coproporphyrinogen-3 oxidase
MWRYHSELIERPVPRYTSYPPATAFREDVGADAQAQALNAVGAGTPLSLYVHIPYCQQICWYCGCNTGVAGKTHRLTAYLAALEAEISLVAKMLGGRGKLHRIAFGGGSPNAIDPIAFVRLVDRLVTIFGGGQAPDISVEIDPRAFTPEWAMTLAIAQVSRVSFGVQSFDEHIQAAIGRIQPVSMIDTCISALRARGIKAINFDLMYGLPNQTLADLDATIDETLRLRPSRIALFGYAHLPQMLPRQRRIDDSNLPDQKLRFEQSAHGYRRLTEAGYIPIGFDHFALPEDPLAAAAAAGRVNRNFQGFTEDDAPVLLGFGASAISAFPHLIVQNEKRAGHYRELIGAGRLAAVRGVALDGNQRERAVIIRDLLCNGRARLSPEWQDAARPALAEYDKRGVIDWQGDDLLIRDSGLPYARHVAAEFDRLRGHVMVEDHS